MKLFVLMALAMNVANSQIYNPTINLVSDRFNNPPPVNSVSLAHQEVVSNAAQEAQLPDELRNNFYKNPQIASALAKESWLTNKEFPVFHRDTQDIPREAIAKIIYSAGFLNHRRKR